MGGWLSRRFGVDVPVVSAPMAGAAGGRLAAAVSAGGALGMIGAGGAATPDWIRAQGAVAAASGRPYGVGLLAWVVERAPEQLEAVVALRPALVSVSFGDYRAAAGRLREAGIAVATQVGTLAEARAARSVGVDVLVARGLEGGGHGRGEVATLPLLQAVLEEMDLPVLAAGGIGSARGLAAVLAAGAEGAWVGTAFLACEEATTTAGQRRRLLAADETATVYGRVFDVAPRFAWPPQYGGRALRNAFYERWAGREAELSEDDAAHERYRSAVTTDDLDVAAVYAGQGVGGLAAVRPAAEVVAGFAAAADLLRQAASTWNHGG